MIPDNPAANEAREYDFGVDGVGVVGKRWGWDKAVFSGLVPSGGDPLRLGRLGFVFGV